MKRDYARLEVIERNEQTIYLLGTAHVSKESVEEVKALVAEVEPEAIAVEPARPATKRLPPLISGRTSIFSK